MSANIEDHEFILQAKLLAHFIHAWTRTPEISIRPIRNCKYLVRRMAAFDYVLPERFGDDYDSGRAPVKALFPALKYVNQVLVLDNSQLCKNCGPKIADLHDERNSPPRCKPGGRDGGKKRRRSSDRNVWLLKSAIADKGCGGKKREMAQTLADYAFVRRYVSPVTMNVYSFDLFVKVARLLIPRIDSAYRMIWKTADHIDLMSQLQPFARKIIDACRRRANLWQKVVRIVSNIHRTIGS
jgi:hypothetical protein